LKNELNILDFSNLKWVHPHILIWHASPSTMLGKVVWHTIHTLLRTCLEHIDIFAWQIGSFMKIKWFWCIYGTTIASMFVWSSGSIWHVCGLANLVLNLENELMMCNSTWSR
jgi:hypothetical protein